jgi:hypothetical protein
MYECRQQGLSIAEVKEETKSPLTVQRISLIIKGYERKLKRGLVNG